MWNAWVWLLGGAGCLTRRSSEPGRAVPGDTPHEGLPAGRRTWVPRASFGGAPTNQLDLSLVAVFCASSNFINSAAPTAIEGEGLPAWK